MRPSRPLLFLAVLGWAAFGLAETRTYGTTATSYMTIGSADLQPENNVQGYVRAFGVVTASGNFYATPKPPSGALLTLLHLDFCDDVGGMSPFFAGYLIDRSGGVLASAMLAPSPIASGCRTITVAFPADTVFDPSTTRLVLEVHVVSAQAINGFVLGYQLQVSPAPAIATFPDVPTTDFGFQYVEALVASGITGGCGGGNYCPDQPVTRRQMAIFLAKALGLQWQ